MEPINWPVSINKYRNYIIECLKRSVGQHQWKDVLEMLKCLLHSTSLKHESYFVWKVIHCLMINLNVKTSVQAYFIRAFENYIEDPHIMYLEWIFQSFDIESKDEARSIFFDISKREKICEGPHQTLSNLQCFAYFKVHRFYEWAKELDKNGASHELKKEGISIYKALEESYENLMNYYPDIENVKINEYELSQPKTCEWLVSPMLDYRKRIVAMGFSKPDETADLAFLNKYIENAGNHLHALKLSVNYITSTYPNRKLVIAKLLQRICVLSPSDPIVLYYIKFFRKKSSKALKEAFKNEEVDVDFESDMEVIDDCSDGELEDLRHAANTELKNSCKLNDVSVSVTLHCIQTLLDLLEYPEWEDVVEPWEMLMNYLKKLYLSWINCYYCQNCIKSRIQIRKILRRLCLWPVKIWRKRLTKNATPDQALIASYRSFSAWVLGFDKQNIIDVRKDLSIQGYTEILLKLDDLIYHEGPSFSKVLKYLSKNRKTIISKLSLYPEVRQSGNTFFIEIIPQVDSEMSVDNKPKHKKRKRSTASPQPNKK